MFHVTVLLQETKVRLYSALFTVRCGALPHFQLKFERGYDKTPRRMVNNAEYKLTFTGSGALQITYSEGNSN